VGEDFEVLLLGSDMNVYGMARSFHEQYGVTCSSLGKTKLGAITHSKILNHKIIEHFEEEEVFLRAVVEMRNTFSTKNVFLIACGDTYVDKIIKYKEALGRLYILPYVNIELADQLRNKTSFYEMCRKHGLKYPKTQVVQKNSFHAESLQIPFPVVLKPADSVMYWLTNFQGKKKAFLAHNESQLKHILKIVYASGYTGDFILQEFIPGDDSSIAVINNYSDQNGRVVMQSFGNVLLEDHSPDGIGSHMAIMSNREFGVENIVKAFLEKIGFKGFSNFDLKFDARDDTYKFFEINLRQGRSSFFTTNAGCNLAKYLVEDFVLGKKIEYEVGQIGQIWSAVPKSVILRYVKSSAARRMFLEAYTTSGMCNSLMYPADMSIRRFISQKRDSWLQNIRYWRYFSTEEL
jgi:D-aspartate ligase